MAIAIVISYTYLSMQLRIMKSISKIVAINQLMIDYVAVCRVGDKVYQVGETFKQGCSDW